MMLGLITTPAVRVPADFKKVLLLVFIVVNNQDLFYLFWNVFYSLNQSSIVFFLDFLKLALGKPFRMICSREKRARKSIPAPWPWARRLNVSGNMARLLTSRVMTKT